MVLNIDFIYPIGSIYMSTNSTNPNILFGGTWEAIGGRVLMGAGASGKNTRDDFGSIPDDQAAWVWAAGEKGGEYYHYLTENELPSHRHNIWYNETENGYAQASAMAARGSAALDPTPYGEWPGVVFSQYTGGNGGHGNIQPYLVVYMWQRIA